MKSIKINSPIPGPNAQKILSRRAASMPSGLGKATEVVVAKSEGGIVWDVDGNELLDFAGGIGMLNLGHRPEKIVNAIKNQLDKYIHSSSLVTTFEPYVELAEMLNNLTPGDFPKKTLLANSGSEAVENAVNIAKYYTKRNAVICFEGCYHGRTTLALSLTSKYSLFKKGFSGFVSDIFRLPFPNLYRKPEQMTDEEFINYSINQFENAFVSQVDPSAVAAIIIEPLQGEAGFLMTPTPFLKKIREVCDANGIVLIADEIQAGASRTGKFLSIEHSGVIPDIVTMAKSIGSGMPISAIVGKAEIMDSPHLGGIGGTYTGSPLATVAAIESVKLLSTKEFMERATHVGNIISSLTDKWVQKYSFIGDSRGVGAMRLIEIVKDKKSKTPDADLTLKIIKECVSNGIILIRAGLYSNCIRLLPPIVMTDEQLKEGLEVLESAIAKQVQ